MFNHLDYKNAAIENPNLEDIDNYDIEIEQPELTDQNQYVYKCICVHHLTPEENVGKHHIFVDVIDENNNRMNGTFVNWTWEGRQPNQTANPIKIDKPDNEVNDLVIWSNQNIAIWLDGYSDIVKNLNTIHPDEPSSNGELWNSIGHHSFYVLFKKQKAGDAPTQPPLTDKRFDDLLERVEEIQQELNDLVEEAKIWV